MRPPNFFLLLLLLPPSLSAAAAVALHVTLFPQRILSAPMHELFADIESVGCGLLL